MNRSDSLFITGGGFGGDRDDEYEDGDDEDREDGFRGRGRGRGGPPMRGGWGPPDRGRGGFSKFCSLYWRSSLPFVCLSLCMSAILMESKYTYSKSISFLSFASRILLESKS